MLGDLIGNRHCRRRFRAAGSSRIYEFSARRNNVRRCTSAMIYAYRYAADSPVRVKMVSEAVGPSSFYQSDRGVYGLDIRTLVKAEKQRRGCFALCLERKSMWIYSIRRNIMKSSSRFPHLCG